MKEIYTQLGLNVVLILSDFGAESTEVETILNDLIPEIKKNIESFEKGEKRNRIV